jgi:hypothetical protein
LLLETKHQETNLLLPIGCIAVSCEENENLVGFSTIFSSKLVKTEHIMIDLKGLGWLFIERLHMGMGY